MVDKEFVNDLFVRQQRIRAALRKIGADALLLATDIHIYYVTGIVFSGYYYLPVDDEPVLFVKRPDGLSGERLFSIRKPEDITDIFSANGWKSPKNLLIELDALSYNDALRLLNIFLPLKVDSATTFMRRIRMVKTSWETKQLRISAARHAVTYAKIPECYRPGITDLQFQAEIERQMRLNGSTGVFRTFGPNMQIFMGSLLAGKNAEAPSPYDFALGGQGQTPLCPIGANGTRLRTGMSVMVDMAGNYTDYLTDMTRTYAIGRLPEAAYRAHQASLDIQEAVVEAARPGVLCADLYQIAYNIVEKYGLTNCFMGARQQAKFVGHGIGLEINEPPVLTPRSKDALKPGVAFALEPKFVLPNVGAVGVENSFLVTETGVEKLTIFEENIMPLA